MLGLHNTNKQKGCLYGSLAVMNPHANVGKTTSLITGLQHIPPNFEVLAISAVDQPRRLEIYQRLLQARQDNSAMITAPTYEGKMGYPLLFGNGMRCLRRAVTQGTRTACRREDSKRATLRDATRSLLKSRGTLSVTHLENIGE